MWTYGVALEGIKGEIARRAVAALLVVELGRWLRLGPCRHVPLRQRLVWVAGWPGGPAALEGRALAQPLLAR